MSLINKVDQFNNDADIAHQIVHGDATTTVATEGGPVRSFSKLIADKDKEFNSNDILQQVASARDAALEAETGAELARDAAMIGTLSSNRVDLLRATTPFNKSYLIKDNGRSFFGVGFSGSEKSSEFEFNKDPDGLILVRYGRVGVLRESETAAQATNFRDESNNQIDISAITKSGDNAYFSSSQVGYKFDINFVGTGLIFNKYVNNQGGMWRVTIPEVGFSKDVSTARYGPSGNGLAEVIVNGLNYGEYIATFEFLGADPLFPPEPGGPRGWFKYDDGQSPKVPTAYIYSGDELAMKWLGSSLVVAGIIEFAVSATPAESSLSADWVPSHGGKTGAAVVQSRRIWIDGIERDNELVTWPADKEYPISEFLMKQTYIAYNTNDTEKNFPMWDGILVHQFKDGILTITNEITMLRDVYIGSGYAAMVSARNSLAEKLVLDNGYEDVTLGISENRRPGMANSAEFYSDSGSVRIAVSPLSVYESTTQNKTYGAKAITLRTDRADGFGKIYWYWVGGGTSAVVPSGEKLKSTHRILMVA